MGTRGGRRGRGRALEHDGISNEQAPDQLIAVPSLTADDAADDALYAFAIASEGGLRPERRHFKLFHGTSWENAKRIKAEGFMLSHDGCLGRGIYLSRLDKARRFARDRARHGGDEGGLLTVIVRTDNPKFVRGNDKDWAEEGYDACRTDFTSASDHMEWVVRSQEQIVSILSIEKMVLRDDDSEAPAEGEIIELTADALKKLKLQTAEAVERRQFNCAQHGTFWKKVVARKPVARCKECPFANPRLDAIPKHEERGRGHFVCAECGHHWSTNNACRSLAQACTADGCSAYERQLGTLPHKISKPVIHRFRRRPPPSIREDQVEHFTSAGKHRLKSLLASLSVIASYHDHSSMELGVPARLLTLATSNCCLPLLPRPAALHLQHTFI